VFMYLLCNFTFQTNNKAMKSLQKSTFIVAVLSLVLVGFNANSATWETGKGDKEEGIQSLFGQLEKAINARHFETAKEAVNKMLPLMKKDIKESKKALSSWDKGTIETNLDKNTFASYIIIKNEIYTSTKTLINSSPAAIRVKGKNLVEMLNEYVSLVNQ